MRTPSTYCAGCTCDFNKVIQDEAETNNSPVKEVNESESDLESSVDLEGLLHIKNDDDDDGDDSDMSSDGYGTTGSTAEGVSSPKNAKNHPGEFMTDFHATLTSLSDSATSKTPGTIATHLRNPNPPPVQPYLPPTAEIDQPHRSTRTQRAPVRDDNERYSKSSYGNQSAHKLSGGTSVAGGERGDNEGDNVMQVTNVTDESVNATHYSR